MGTRFQMAGERCGYHQPLSVGLKLWLHQTPISRAEYECFQIELSKNYGMMEWRDDIKKVLLKAGLHNLPITFLFSDTQVLLPLAVGGVQGVLATTHLSAASCKVFSPSSPGHYHLGWLLGGTSGTRVGGRDGAKPGLSELRGIDLYPKVKTATGTMADHKWDHTY